jgi:ribosomal protein L39E
MAKRNGKVRMSGGLKARLASTVRQNRRETVYKMLLRRQDCVPCFVCTRHVEEHKASLEHVIPLAHGGTDDMENLSISHTLCNQFRGDLLADSDEFMALRAALIADQKFNPIWAAKSSKLEREGRRASAANTHINQTTPI